jgi:hypothetical protein
MSRAITKVAAATAISMVAGLGLTASTGPASAAQTCPGQPAPENTNTVNQAPVLANDTAAVQAGTSVLVRVLSNDSDPDGDQLAVVGASASRGVTCVGAQGLVRYTPNVGRNDRTDTFTYGVTDGDRYRTGTVTVDVTGLKPIKPVLRKRLILKHNGKVKQRARLTITNNNTKRVMVEVEGLNTEKTLAERFVYPGRSFTLSTKERQVLFASLLAPKTGELVFINVGRLNTRNGAMYSQYVGEAFDFRLSGAQSRQTPSKAEIMAQARAYQ